MNRRCDVIFLILFQFIILCIDPGPLKAQEAPWVMVDKGLFVGEFVADQNAIAADAIITIVKIEPAHYALRLLCASEFNHANLSVKAWCQKYGLIAAINAGMYQTDYRSNVGYMKNYSHINNSRISSKYYSVAAFNPIDQAKPYFRIYDVDEEEIDEVIKRYHTVIQNLRLIKRPARNRWSQQNKRWSEVALGEDRDGNVLFIFTRYPYSMHDFNELLIRLPINIVCAQHLEGGPEASLFFLHRKFKIEAYGSYEMNYAVDDNPNGYLPIPNVIGLVKRKK